MTDSLPGSDSATAARTAIAWDDAERERAFGRWLEELAPRHRLDRDSLHLASADASARRYFRVAGVDGGSFIVMDSPAAEDSVAAFVRIGGLVREAGLNGPRVLEQDMRLGFLLLDDLGDTPYLAALRQADTAGADALMRDAIAALIQWQLKGDCSTLPPYDDALLRREVQLFPDWCVAREFGVVWTPKEQDVWRTVSQRLIDSALAQPQVAVHRDWMPRNLMVCARNPGVLDFQDAVYGPITYDIASLMRDAFLTWEEDYVLDVTVRYWQKARKAGLPVGDDFGAFYRAVEWMGLQRHLKILGIFVRLTLKNGKPRYLADTPRFIGYARSTCARYRQLGPLMVLLDEIEGNETRVGYTF